MTYRLFILLSVSLALLTIGCVVGTDGDGQSGELAVYVADKMNDRIVLLDSEGNVMDMCEVVRRPTDVSLYPGVNALWVADYAMDKVLKLDLNLDVAGSSDEGLLNDPITVSVTANGDCWVADRVNHGFVRLNEDAEELARVTLEIPTRTVAYDHVNGYCWCADDVNGDLYAFDADLTGDKTAADARVTVTGLGVIRCLAVDQDRGRVWASDTDGDRVLCMDSDGEVLFTADDVNDPWGLSLDASGDCWVAQRGGGGAVLLLSAADGSVLETYDGLNGPVDVAAEPAGGVWVALETGNAVALLRDGETVLTVAGFSSPSSVEVYDADLW